MSYVNLESATSKWDIFVNCDWKIYFFYEFGAPYMAHLFYGIKLCILLTNIYQKHKTESVYLIPKNNYGPFSEIDIFQNFPFPQQKNDDIIKSMAPF